MVNAALRSSFAIKARRGTDSAAVGRCAMGCPVVVVVAEHSSSGPVLRVSAFLCFALWWSSHRGVLALTCLFFICRVVTGVELGVLKFVCLTHSFTSPAQFSPSLSPLCKWRSILTDDLS